MTEARRDIAERIDAARPALVARIVQRHYERDPELERRYGPRGRARCAEDADYHLHYLSEAIRAGSPALFVDYAVWAADMLASRSVPAADLDANLEVLVSSVAESLGAAEGAVAAVYVDAARRAIAAPAAGAPAPLSDLARRYLLLLLEGRRREAEQLVVGALADGTPLHQIYIDVFQGSQREVGRLWQRNQLTIAQEHLCTAATERIMARVIATHTMQARLQRCIVIASVASEQHEMGARVLADFFEMDGWDAIFLGANTPASGVVEVVRDRQAAALAISATMTFHIPQVRDVIIRVRAHRDLSGVRVLVGGHPFNVDPDLWRRVGADGYAPDARSAVLEARRLTG